MTGKRHPYSSDYKIGLAADGRILAYEATYYQNAGAAADLSPAILERSLFHATGSYFVPNVLVTALSCKTNLPPFTAFRGFGAPQAMFVFESAITHAAEVMGSDRLHIQRTNLLAEGDTFPYGMKAQQGNAQRAFNEVETLFDVAGLRREIDEHNAADSLTKRGLAMMPVCFGISFTSTFLNQAAALVHVYTDGSVSVSTGAVEMGQGVNAKMLGVAAHTLGIAPSRITVETTNTLRVANTSPTAASSGADMNGGATEIACRTLLERLRAVAGQLLEVSPDAVAIRRRPCPGRWRCQRIDVGETGLGDLLPAGQPVRSGPLRNAPNPLRPRDRKRRALRVPRIWQRCGGGHGGRSPGNLHG